MIPAIKWLNSARNKLFVLESDIYTLYRVDSTNIDGLKIYNVHQINSCSATLPTAKQEQDTIRSYALDHSADNYLAIGFASGRICIFPAEIDATIKFIRGEEIREVQKCITNLEWNFHDSNRLCAAYERGRGPDHTVVIYDMNRTLRNTRELPVSVFEANFTEKVFGIAWFKEDANLLLISAYRGIRIADIREHGNFQSTLSVQNPMMGVSTEPTYGFLFACYSKNSIFIYDRRFLTFSPLHEIRSCPSNKFINKLCWHPKRNFNLSATIKDSGAFYNFSISKNAFRPNNHQISEEIYHHHLKEAADSVNDLSSSSEHYYGTQIYSIPGVQKLGGSFDWHPQHFERVAFLSAAITTNRTTALPSTSTITTTKDIIIANFRGDISCDFSCHSDFAISNCQTELDIKEQSQCDFMPETEKIKIFKSRIANDYGYGNTLCSLSTLIENSRKAIEQDIFAGEDLKFCWQWICAMFQSTEANETQKAYGTIFAGIKQILKGTKSNSTIKQDEITFRNRIFVNEKRLRILRMCNWPNYNDRDDSKLKFDELSNKGGVKGIARAAALALFSVQGILCKEYLIHLNEFVHSNDFIESNESNEFISSYQKMADIVLNIIHKYDGVRVPDYENICEQLENDYYLLAIVKFLARRDKIYNKIYNEIFESNIDLEDKLAFASLHMDDEFFNTALNKLIKELLQTRPLSALLIVGLEDQPETHQLIHRYLDITEDIQTASILFVIGDCFGKSVVMQDATLIGAKLAKILEKAIQSEHRTNLRRRSLQCFREYIDLLNRLRLWLQKTFLSTFLRPKVQHNNADVRSRITNIQAVIACNYCSSPIYPSIAEKIENLRTPKISPYPRRTGTTSSRARTMSCVCRKPLPKCIICRRYLGSKPEPEFSENAQMINSNTSSASAIDHWFVWCSNCNHGGHLSHIRDWFNSYPICASYGCDCLCLQRDNMLKNELQLQEEEANKEE